MRPVEQLKAEFDAAHAEGVAALKNRDYGGLSAAIEREGQLVDELQGRIDRASGPTRRPQRR